MNRQRVPSRAVRGIAPNRPAWKSANARLVLGGCRPHREHEPALLGGRVEVLSQGDHGDAALAQFVDDGQDVRGRAAEAVGLPAHEHVAVRELGQAPAPSGVPLTRLKRATK
jgi:hypothetical protein